MEEHTGNYNKCDRCAHIYDFNDICPECGSDEVQDINVHEIEQYGRTATDEEAFRLERMLHRHGDLTTRL